MLDRIWRLTIKELLQLMRNRIMAPLILIGPLLEMSLIAWATSAPIHHLPTAVVDLDRSEESRALLTALRNTETFDFNFYLDDPAQMTPYLERGQAVAGVLIPANYSRRLSNPAAGPPEVGFVLDGSDPISAREALNSAQGTTDQLNQELIMAGNSGQKADLNLVQPRLRGNLNQPLI